MCWRVVWEATDVTEDGVTASGYGAENAWEVRAVRYSPVSIDLGPSREGLWAPDVINTHSERARTLVEGECTTRWLRLRSI